MYVRPFIGILALVLVGACNRQPAAASQTTAATATPAAQPAPAAAQPAAQPAGAAQTPAAPGAQPGPETPKPVPAVLPQVLAKIGDQPVGREELEKAVKEAEARAGKTVPPTERDAVYRGLLDRVILFRLLASEAKVRGVTVTPQEVTDRIAQIKQQFPEFEKELIKRHMTMAQFEEEQRLDILNTKTVQAEVEPRLAVTEQELDAFYKSNPDQFKEQEAVRASHILFGVAKDAAPAAKEAARTEAEGVLKRAKAGEDFAALAKQYSKDPGSAAVGGDLNFFPKGQMVPAFDAAAFALKTGEISNLIETEFGFHIIKLTDKRAGRIVPLAEVKPRLEEFLKQRKQQELVQQYLLSLKAKYRVEVLI